MSRRYWVTKNGVVIEERGRRIERGVVKIDAYKMTGGRHGWLRLDRLTRRRPPTIEQRMTDLERKVDDLEDRLDKRGGYMMDW